jgi:hypothetical protein
MSEAFLKKKEQVQYEETNSKIVGQKRRIVIIK